MTQATASRVNHEGTERSSGIHRARFTAPASRNGRQDLFQILSKGRSMRGAVNPLQTAWMRRGREALRLEFERVVEVILRVGHLGFAGGDPAMHRNACLMHAFR